jgi:hypothetical protein
MFEKVLNDSKEIAHYSVFKTTVDSMDAIRVIFPSGKADEMNAVLFSTSGVHGTYTTIEDAEKLLPDEFTQITFLIIHPRIVCIRYGNVTPKNQQDIDFLYSLRRSSADVLSAIGRPNLKDHRAAVGRSGASGCSAAVINNQNNEG